MISTFTIHIIILFIIALLLLLNLIYKKKKEPFFDVTSDNIKLIQNTVDSIYDIKMNNIRTLSNITSKLLKGTVSSDLVMIGGMDIIPTGYIMAYTGRSDIIQYIDFNGNNVVGWFICDGRAISKKIYERLYNKIGYIFTNDTTDKSLFFNLPDYRGAFLRGNGSSVLNPNNASTDLNTSQDCSMINHTHNIIDNQHTHNLNFNYDVFANGEKRSANIDSFFQNNATQAHMLQGKSVGEKWGRIPYQDTSSKSVTGITIANVLSYNNRININLNETRPSNYAVNWIIKT